MVVSIAKMRINIGKMPYAVPVEVDVVNVLRSAI